MSYPEFLLQLLGGTVVETSPQSPREVLLPDRVSKELVRLFKLLADETRLRILFFLLENTELHVRALCDLLGQSQPAVSHHLALLRTDGLIECRREGKHNYYRVLPERFRQLRDMMFQTMPRVASEIGIDEPVHPPTP